MKFLKIFVVIIIFGLNNGYASQDPCKDANTLVLNVVSEIVNCKKNNKCSVKKLEQYKETLSELLEILELDPDPSKDCIKILEAHKAIRDYFSEIKKQ